jgi:hypothetical protein
MNCLEVKGQSPPEDFSQEITAEEHCGEILLHHQDLSLGKDATAPFTPGEKG